jgi:hypothetical protein
MLNKIRLIVNDKYIYLDEGLISSELHAYRDF